MLTAGTRLGPYEILAPLGAGGMGEVYRACDIRLGREVALKLVPPELLHDDLALKRFHQEARTLSSLSHPNIASLFEFDSDQDVEFLVMELVSGVSLRKKLAAGPLATKELLALGLQLAQALAAAHAVGIVHRDLKPENLMVTPEGRLKVLDFGLAKFTVVAATAGATASFVTEAGSAPGTVPYMAPEQLRGEPADARLDIYAAGAVLYEMATGQRMFAESGPMLVDAILHRQPPPPMALNPRIPSQLNEIILKALEKEPERRYQSPRELAIDLERLQDAVTRPTSSYPVATGRWRRWQSTLLPLAAFVVLLLGVWLGTRRNPPANTTAANIQSLAVLPLANLSGDPQQEYFADGMTEELTSDLAKLGAFSVISRTSAMQYKGTKKTLPEIARELNVDVVIEGSVLRDRDRVRITAQLINARLDRHIWSDSYEGDLHNVFDLQSNVAHAIAEHVQSKLASTHQAQPSPHRAVAPDVLDLYLRGLYQRNQGPDGIKPALASFQQAIARDPSFAPAYAQIADADVSLGILYLPPRDIMPQAKANAEKALALDDTLSQAHVALGEVHFWYEWDWPATERELQRALALDKNNADAHGRYGVFLSAMGQFDRGQAEFQRAQELDPLTGVNRTLWTVMARRYDLAIANGKRRIEIAPQAALAHSSLGLAYAMKGQYAEGVAEAEAAHRLSSSPMITSFLASIYARAGRRADAEQTLASLKEQLKRRYSCEYEVAVAYVELGQAEEAFHWFQRGYDDRAMCMVMTKVDPRLDRIHADPRYQDMLKRLNFPQ